MRRSFTALHAGFWIEATLALAEPVAPGDPDVHIPWMQLATTFRASWQFALLASQQWHPAPEVFRLWGGESGPFGHSWTSLDPSKIGAYRAGLGLPDVNSAFALSRGRLRDGTGISTRFALPLDGNPGGLPEVLIPNPFNQVDVISVHVFPGGLWKTAASLAKDLAEKDKLIVDYDDHVKRLRRDRYRGMSVNERLFASGKQNEFDRLVQSRDREQCIQLLIQLSISRNEAETTVDLVMKDPSKYGLS